MNAGSLHIEGAAENNLADVDVTPDPESPDAPAMHIQIETPAFAGVSLADL